MSQLARAPSLHAPHPTCTRWIRASVSSSFLASFPTQFSDADRVSATVIAAEVHLLVQSVSDHPNGISSVSTPHSILSLKIPSPKRSPCQWTPSANSDMISGALQFEPRPRTACGWLAPCQASDTVGAYAHLETSECIRRPISAPPVCERRFQGFSGREAKYAADTGTSTATDDAKSDTSSPSESGESSPGTPVSYLPHMMMSAGVASGLRGAHDFDGRIPFPPGFPAADAVSEKDMAQYRDAYAFFALRHLNMLSSARLPPRSPRQVFVVLERASLELCAPVAAHGHGNGKPRSPRSRASDAAALKPTLLNCDEHQGLIAKTGREVSEARPDITHQCLLTLLDSPLNKAGLLRIFIHTSQDVLIEVHPEVRIPRTFKRYSGLMAQLLQQGTIRGATNSEVLLHICDRPLSAYLPTDTVKIALSAEAETEPVRLAQHLNNHPLSSTHSLTFFVGAMARGADDFVRSPLVDEKVRISEYSLCASVVCGKVCGAVEDLYQIC